MNRTDRFKILLATAALGLAGGVGCISVSTPEPAPIKNPSDLNSPRAPVEPISNLTPSPPLPTGDEAELSLSRAVQLSLTHHPELAVDRWTVHIEEARKEQAALRPNPEVGLEVENILGTGDHRGGRQAETTLALSQVIELGDKRARRVQAASLARDAAAWRYEARRLQIITQTSEAFLEVLVGQERLALQEEQVRMAHDVLLAVSQRVQEAVSPAVDQARAELALAEAETDHAQTRRLLEEARRQLAAFWNESEPTFERVTGQLTTDIAIPPLEAWRNHLGRHPRLARWATEMARRQAEFELEVSKRYPDLTVLGGYRRLSGPDDHAFLAGISIPLPWFDQNQGRIREAAHELNRAEQQRLADEWNLSNALDRDWHRLATSAAHVQDVQGKILPAAHEAFAAAQRHYEQGRFTYLEVLEAQRGLIAARTRHLKALGEYHHARLAIESLVGEAWDQVAHPNPNLDSESR